MKAHWDDSPMVCIRHQRNASSPSSSPHCTLSLQSLRLYNPDPSESSGNTGLGETSTSWNSQVQDSVCILPSGSMCETNFEKHPASSEVWLRMQESSVPSCLTTVCSWSESHIPAMAFQDTERHLGNPMALTRCRVKSGEKQMLICPEA